MNKNSTPKGKRIIPDSGSTSRNIAVVAIAMLLSFYTRGIAQNIRIPYPASDIQTTFCTLYIIVNASSVPVSAKLNTGIENSTIEQEGKNNKYL
jgi:hypothetical protein